MFAPTLDHPVNKKCFYYAKTEIRSDFKCVFIIILNSCPLRFSHNFTVLPWMNYPTVTTTKPYFFISCLLMKCQRFFIYTFQKLKDTM